MAEVSNIGIGECRENDIFAQDCPALVKVLGQRAAGVLGDQTTAPVWINACFKTEGCIAEKELVEEIK